MKKKTVFFSFDLGLSSSSSFISAHTSSPSGISATSNKNRTLLVNGNHSQQRDDLAKPSKSSSSVTSNIGTALSVLANNNMSKPYVSNSISLHGDVNTFVSAQNNDHHLSTSALNEVDPSSTTTVDSRGNSLVKRKDRHRLISFQDDLFFIQHPL